MTGAALFENATSENAVLVLRLAISRFGYPASMLTDNGSCFVGRNGRKTPARPWRPTVFEEELLVRDISLITTRPYHPETNGKLEKFHHSIEKEIFHYARLEEYIDYYNEKRLHFALDMKNYETPSIWRSGRRMPRKRSGKATQIGWRGMPWVAERLFI